MCSLARHNNHPNNCHVKEVYQFPLPVQVFQFVSKHLPSFHQSWFCIFFMFYTHEDILTFSWHHWHHQKCEDIAGMVTVHSVSMSFTSWNHRKFYFPGPWSSAYMHSYGFEPQPGVKSWVQRLHCQSSSWFTCWAMLLSICILVYLLDNFLHDSSLGSHCYLCLSAVKFFPLSDK